MQKVIQFKQQSPEAFGIILKILSVLGFSIMFGCIKALGNTIPIGQAVFFRSAIALIPLFIFMHMTTNIVDGMKTTYPMQHIIRCLAGTVAMFLSFAALRYLPIAEATAISYLSPIIIVILAVILLKESINIKRCIGVFCGFLGLATITIPNFSANASMNTLIGIGLSFSAAVMIAIAMIQIRQLNTIGERPATITFYFALTSTVISAITLLHDWQTPNGTQLLLLVSIGLLGGFSQILMTLAFKFAQASALAAYDYLSIIWAILIGFAFFSETPSTFFWVAMPLILLGAIINR